MANDLDYLLIGIPLFGSWLFLWLIGGMNKMKEGYERPWFFPPEWLFAVIWSVIYLIVGYLLYKSRRAEDMELFWLLIGFVFLTYIWTYTFIKGERIRSFYLIFITLLVAFMAFVELLFSNMVDSDSPSSLSRGYVHLFVPVIVWLILAGILSAFSPPSKMLGGLETL